MEESHFSRLAAVTLERLSRRTPEELKQELMPFEIARLPHWIARKGGPVWLAVIVAAGCTGGGNTTPPEVAAKKFADDLGLKLVGSPNCTQIDTDNDGYVDVYDPSCRRPAPVPAVRGAIGRVHGAGEWLQTDRLGQSPDDDGGAMNDDLRELMSAAISGPVVPLEGRVPWALGVVYKSLTASPKKPAWRSFQVIALELGMTKEEFAAWARTRSWWAGAFLVAVPARSEEEMARLRRRSVALYDGEEPKGGFTCDGCGVRWTCTLVFDWYNTNGDCLAEK